MNAIEINSGSEQDQSAVAAVRGGDTERYRELVERHERRVYAVAWSRLGDTTLAEEATQEAFIRAYRRLWLLGDGAKFSGWIATIARHVAINLGLRRRRELNRRQRWALENFPESAPEKSVEEKEPLHSPETLRQTLADLPVAHRECLVLFYLEGKSGAEAAAALGISESALRVRLHRARAALRERLEEKLADSLKQLRPTKALSSAVMAGVMASSSAKAASGGAAVLAMLTKLPFLAWLLPLIAAVIGMLPVIAMNAAAARAEQRNYRDAEGFRAQMSRVMNRKLLWVVPVTVLPVVLGLLVLKSKVGLPNTYTVEAIFMVAVFVFFWFTQHNRFQHGITIWYAMLTGGMVLMATGVISSDIFTLNFIAATAWLIHVVKKQPKRMDASLFFRARLGILKAPPAHIEITLMGGRLTKYDLMRFARFLGDRWLVNDYRWKPEGLLLREGFINPTQLLKGKGFRRNSSNLLLTWDGKVTAQETTAGQPMTDASRAAKLTGMQERVAAAVKAAWAVTDASLAAKREDVEVQVAAAVKFAWQEFRRGNVAEAEKAIGETPEGEIFLVPPARAASTRWQQASLALVVVMFSTMFVMGRLPAILDALKTLFPR